MPTIDLIELIRHDPAPEQVANVAFLPGIQYASLAMPDIHWGYGFCIGGVCATDPDEGGVISPGGVGYDINCGVRLVRSNLFLDDVQPHLEKLVEELVSTTFRRASGAAASTTSRHDELRRTDGTGPRELDRMASATERDIEFTEATGGSTVRKPDSVSDRALRARLRPVWQLGSGNHFMEVQVVDHVFDQHGRQRDGTANTNMVCVMIHSGSRGLGYQVCDDALRMLRNVPQKYGIELPDRQLVCAPIESPEGRRRTWARCGRGQLRLVQSPAANVAGPRGVRDDFRPHLAGPGDEAGLRRGSQHRQVRGAHRRRCSRRWFGCIAREPHAHFRRIIPEVPEDYTPTIGQPVLIPGDMGRASWVLVGQPGSMERTFGSACHGAGRSLSRHAAIRKAQGRRIDHELRDRGVDRPCPQLEGPGRRATGRLQRRRPGRRSCP